MPDPHHLGVAHAVAAGHLLVHRTADDVVHGDDQVLLQHRPVAGLDRQLLHQVRRQMQGRRIRRLARLQWLVLAGVEPVQLGAGVSRVGESRPALVSQRRRLLPL